MTASMTGYGRGERDSPVGAMTCEIRAVNHRFCEVFVRLPRSLASLEDRVRRQVQAAVARGRLEVSVSLSRGSANARTVRVDTDLALAYHQHLKELGEKLGIGGEITLEMVSRLPEVLILEEADVEAEAIWPDLSATVAAALAELSEMRRREGAALANDLARRVEKLRQLQAVMVASTQLLPQLFYDKLQKRLAELLPPGSAGAAALEPGRLEAEVALLAERADVSEELLRLQSHLDQFVTILAAQEPIGRKLDFLIQELNREVNTIGSKVGDLATVRHVLEAKAELEKMREQVQNIE